MKLSIDFETRATLDLKKVGVHKYARHPDTDVWCMAWAFDDEEPLIYVPGDTDIQDIRRVWAHVEEGGEVRAWNAQFERVIWNEILVKWYGLPPLSMEQVHDTAAEAAALGLPRSLEHAAKVLGLDVEKDMEGHRLMMQMCKPRKRKNVPGLHWWDDAERRERLYEYCKDDVRVEQAIMPRLRRLSKMEREVYLMDQRMNDRGVYIDLDLVNAAEKLSDQAVRYANFELNEVTDGECAAVTNPQRMKAWVGSKGLELPDFAKDTVRDTLANADLELDEAIERALEIRAEAGKSSVKKLVAMRNGAEEDQSARGLYLYHAATTGRWGGKRIQPQNLPRPFKGAESYIPLVLAGEYDLIAIERAVPDVISSLLRAMIAAAPGNILYQGDFAQIEARVVAWIAEQEDLLQLFAEGAKIYEEMAAKIYGVPVGEIENPSERRQIGKNTILGCGFQMGAKRFREYVIELTGVDVGEEMAERAVGTYRELYARIPLFWATINEAALQAIENPGAVYSVGRRQMIRYTVRGSYLWCSLPSGRLLSYAKPHIRNKALPEPWEHVIKPSIAYMGVDKKTKVWRRQFTYGGHLTENVVQAMSRDLTAMAMLRAERAGYPPVITSHDEVVAEVPEDFGSLEEFLKLMRTRPKWAHDLPVEVGGWSSRRYRK